MNIFRFLRKPFAYTFTNVSFYLIFIYIIVYFVQKYFRQRGLFLEEFFALHHTSLIREIWQVFTYMFLHGDFWHLFFNMLMLFWFGVSVERKVGSKEFLLFYLLCGSLAGFAMRLTYYLIGMGAYSYTVGASAALYAVMLAFAVLYPDSQVYLYFVLPIPSAVLVLGYFILELMQAFRSDGIAHVGHVYGLIFAWVYIKVRYRISILKVFGFK